MVSFGLLPAEGSRVARRLGGVCYAARAAAAFFTRAT